MTPNYRLFLSLSFLVVCGGSVWARAQVVQLIQDDQKHMTVGAATSLDAAVSAGSIYLVAKNNKSYLILPHSSDLNRDPVDQLGKHTVDNSTLTEIQTNVRTDKFGKKN